MSWFNLQAPDPAQWLSHYDSTRRELFIASLFLLALLFIGSAGYVLIESWSWLDGLYMTFITLTTIGFSEVGVLSDFGRVFTMLIGISGIGTVAFIATRSAQLMITSKRIRQRQMIKAISKMKDHYILCGFGRIGSRIAQDLLRTNTPFVVVETTQNKIDDLDEHKILHIKGNAEDEDVLRAAGINNAKGLILTLPDDSTNVFVTLVARELNADLFILVRTAKTQNKRKMIRAGADKVISPYEIGADRMAQVLLRPHVDRFMEQVLHSSTFNLLMEEIQVNEGSPLAGKTLEQIDFRRQYELLVVARVEGATNKLDFNPPSSAQVQVGDILIVLGSEEMIQQLQT